jgi:hypothetical protein
VLHLAVACTAIVLTVVKMACTIKLLRSEPRSITPDEVTEELDKYDPDRVVDIFFTLREIACGVVAACLYLALVLSGVVLVALAIVLTLALSFDIAATNTLYRYVLLKVETMPDTRQLVRAEIAHGLALITSAVLLCIVKQIC